MTILLLAFMCIGVIYLMAKINDLKHPEDSMTLWKRLTISGRSGEYKTTKELRNILFYKKIINNCYIPKKDGETTELDIIIISVKGIYVIENKDYSGWIFGNEKSKYWCETFPNKKVKFYNPVWQNEGHIKNLNEFLKLKKDIYNSIICFNNKATLKKLEVNQSKVIVCYSEQLKHIFKNENLKPDILTVNEVNNIYEMLKNTAKYSEKLRRNHIEKVSRYQ